MSAALVEARRISVVSMEIAHDNASSDSDQSTSTRQNTTDARDRFELGAVQQQLSAALAAPDDSEEEQDEDKQSELTGVAVPVAATTLLDPAILTQALVQLGILSPPSNAPLTPKPVVRSRGCYWSANTH